MNKVILASLLMVSALMAAPLTWERLVKSSEEDPVLKAADRRVGSISSGPSLKLWDDLQLRYKMDGFGFLEHDFELRLKPRSAGEEKATRAFWTAQKKYQQARLKVDKSYLIYDRYERALRYVIRQKTAAINEGLYQVNQDRILVLHSKAGSETFDALDLMGALEKTAALKAELISDSMALRDTEMKLRSWVADFDSIALDTTWLPTMDELNAVLKETTTVDSTFPAIAMTKGKWEVNEQRLVQENTGDRDIISHIGLGYKHVVAKKKYKWLNIYDDYERVNPDCGDDPACEKWLLVRSDDDRRSIDKFYLNVAINIPFFSNNNDDVMRRQISVLDAESDYLEEQRNLSQKVARLYEEIGALIAQWKVQKDFVAQVDAGSIFQEFAAAAGSDPLLLLRAKESALESTLKAIKLEFDIFQRYLVLLDYAGVFARDDISNHLKAGLK